MGEVNANRARWAEVAIQAFMRETGSDHGDEALGDLLCDLRHWCDEHGINFKACNRTAKSHYREEKDLDE